MPDVVHSDKGGEFSEIKNMTEKGLLGSIIKYHSNEKYDGGKVYSNFENDGFECFVWIVWKNRGKIY